jgi:hypothetical protein
MTPAPKCRVLVKLTLGDSVNFSGVKYWNALTSGGRFCYLTPEDIKEVLPPLPEPPEVGQTFIFKGSTLPNWTRKIVAIEEGYVFSLSYNGGVLLKSHPAPTSIDRWNETFTRI